ncbi:MAG: ATP-dependent RecD-like DNA helicase [Deltaproteobacteria bacterium]|nr:ATP-dependent RecD-like DNA helicase [Deltaproteobacteria bacterium]
MEGTRLDGEWIATSYQDERTGFAVGRLRLADGDEATVVGPLASLRPGQHAVLGGRWEQHAQHGRQFRAETFLVDDPRTLQGLHAYLGSGIVKGIGPEIAGRLVERFGLDVFRVLEEEPDRLQQVPGVGPARVASIREAWAADRKDREIRATLQGHGFAPSLARRVIERYGSGALAVIRRDPYRMMSEVPGVGFRTADRVARQNGILADDPARVEAAVLHVLAQAAEDDGHCYLPEAEVIERVGKLDVPPPLVREASLRLGDLGRVRIGEARDPGLRPVQQSALARSERSVARHLVRLAARRPHPSLLGVTDAERASGLVLSPGQRGALEAALQEGVVVITGGPGTGKTTLVRVLLAALRRLGESWKLAAPTGRAARRLAEATGQEAATLHRLLDFGFPEMRFRRNAVNPLDADGVIVDEASMVDLGLMEALLEAMPARGRLVLVGDAHQLPPVGPGQVLADIIASGVLPVVTLTDIHRQVAGSGIVVNAHRVDRGEMPVSSEKEPQTVRPAPSPEPRRDFFLVDREEPEEVRAALLEVVTRRLPAHGFHPMDDIQVLVPMHRGDLGTVALNRLLQDALNPTGPTLERHDWRFRVGDRVIQTRNDYDTEVFNGEVGRVLSAAGDELVVDFDGRVVTLAGDALHDLEPAYAITVHKSQGSEYPAVVVVLHRAHQVMLRRNLLYTAITRASAFCCIVGSRPALRLAVNVSGRRDRHTLLDDLLRAEASAGIRP